MDSQKHVNRVQTTHIMTKIKKNVWFVLTPSLFGMEMLVWGALLIHIMMQHLSNVYHAQQASFLILASKNADAHFKSPIIQMERAYLAILRTIGTKIQSLVLHAQLTPITIQHY